MVTEPGTSFATLLRRHRAERGLTQEELGERAGLSARGIRALESGERTTPQRNTVQLLASALHLSGARRVAFESAARGEVAAPARAEPIAGFLGARPAGPLVARERELQALVGMIEGVAGGQGRLVMLAGEPGIGKTRLAQEVTIAARDRAFLVASGRCYEPEGIVPYYPFLEALATIHRAAPESIRAQVGRHWPYLELLLPDLSHTSGSREVAGQDTQHRLFWAVSGFLQAIAEAEPVALVLDDLHWADESSLELLQYLGRETRGSRVLLLGTYRDVDVGPRHPLERALRNLTREGLLEEMALRRLKQEETGALAAALVGATDVSPEFVALIHARTDGNAFFTQEVVRALVERGDVGPQSGSGESRAILEIQVPRSVRSAIGERVGRLSDDAQQVLHEASVLGQTFTFDDLWGMSELTEMEVEGALEDALAATVIRSFSADEYSFNHALTQQTLYTELSPRKRRRLHAAAAGALDRLPDTERRRRAAQISWHFLQAGDRERALPVILIAGDAAEAVFAHVEAEQHYQRAADLARELGDPLREAEALEKLGIIDRIMGRYSDALDRLEHAAALSARAVDIEKEARALRELGFLHYYRGTPEQGAARIRLVIERLEVRAQDAASIRALADLHGALSMVLWPAARYREALETAERGSNLARTVQYEHSQALAETFRGMSLTMVGALPEARQVLEDATLLCVASGETWWTLNTVGNIGRAHLDEGELSRAREYLERAHTLIEAIHDRAEVAWIEANLGEVSYITGEWADARARYDAAATLARDVGDGRFLSYSLLHLAELCWTEGRWDEAQQYIDEGLALARRYDAVPTMRKAQRLLAENDLQAGRPDAAVDRLQPLLGQPEDELPRCFPPPVLAEAHLELGDVAAAEDLVQRRLTRFRVHGHRRALALWLRVDGMVLGRQRQWRDAQAAFEEAISIARSIPYPYAEAHAVAEWGRVLVSWGDIERGRTQLEGALTIAERLGARLSAERIQQELSRLRG